MQKALDGARTEHEVVKRPYGKSKRDALERLSGQRLYPVIEFEDGSVYRAGSKEMATPIGAGRLREADAGPDGNAPQAASDSPSATSK